MILDANDTVLTKNVVGRAKKTGRVDDNNGDAVKKRIDIYKTYKDAFVEEYKDKLKTVRFFNIFIQKKF